MALVKYNPFKDLRTMQEEMNHLLDLAWNRESGEELNEGIWQPPVDIYENTEAVVIKAEVPDMDQQDIEVRIENNTLTLRGERKQNTDIKRENYHRVERYYGTFQRSFTLPQSIDRDKIQASCDRGVLTIILPKTEEIESKQIKVGVK
ncbi:ATP-independent chaperone, alpha-crystallin/Hsp20 family [Geotalea daltonii FRC-32]|uniref:ATP-independent chaperone, alpha-crystallin/Hsp20 family n=1 Tax=Geotalea daltonii (strain DSM 22248 / JCM 15807 / FRC-32) TaxID=316067 RepID=B9M4N9_GEODF|nr:Hsp20/alpha crystallin family protein [Geotalea daltonii]ACM19765.1 ATP-independent chaperone, alpha-crystallin/Hsp20 family [Geotalea daltonii FRC-32]